MRFLVHVDTSNHPLPRPIAVLLNKDVIDRIKRENIVLGLNTHTNAGVLVIKRGGHHAPRNSRGIAQLVTGKARARRSKQSLVKNPLNYMRSAYTTLTTGVTSTSKTRKTASPATDDIVTVEYNSIKFTGPKDAVAKHVALAIRSGMST